MQKDDTTIKRQTFVQAEQYEKYIRWCNLTKNDNSHIFPDQNNRYDTLRKGFIPTMNDEEMQKEMDEIKNKKQENYKKEDWYRYKYAKIFPDITKSWIKFTNMLEDHHYRGQTYYNIRSLDRFDYRDVDYNDFVEKYEKKSYPCIIGGFTEDWKLKDLTYNKLIKDPEQRNLRVKVGKDDEGYAIRVNLSTYVHYIMKQEDDSPIYLFDSQIPEYIQKMYKIPEWFSKDLQHYCHIDRRPPHRWICIGPERSGTTMHKDPLGTSAWNSLIMGCKLWIFFSPNVPKDIALGTRFYNDTNTNTVQIEDETIGWYHRIFPSIREWFMHGNDNDKYTLIEVIQYPGETIFVPCNWWHAVLNINSDTLSVTQNYVNSVNFDGVWRSIRVERPHTAQRWRHTLSYREPKIYQRILELDNMDDFVLSVVKSQYCCSLYQKDLRILNKDAIT